MKDLSIFKQFTVEAKQKTHNKNGKAVIYTRVSTKEQAETNKSLETQKKYCEQLAAKNNIDIIAYFGGTYESAKSDERKEFNKMLTFVKRNKEVSYIIVYSYDRFSRTGANGAYISEQLKKTRSSYPFRHPKNRYRLRIRFIPTKPVLYVQPV